MNLRHWYENVLSTFSETGEGVSSVTLVTVGDGQVWHVWRAPLGDDWPDQSELLLRELASEWPKRAHQCRLIAESGGKDVSVAPFTVQGQSQSALSAATSEQQSLADTAAVHAKTTAAILEASNVQINMLLTTLERLAEDRNSLVDRLKDVVETQGVASDVQERAMSMLETLGPQILARLSAKGQTNGSG